MSQIELRAQQIIDNAALCHQERKEGRLVLQSKPIVVFVELSRRCNLSCPMCNRWSLPRSSFVDMAESDIDWLEQMLFPTAQIVDLHGLGESTLHPQFSNIVRRIAAMGPRVRVVTNLNNVSSASLDSLVETDSLISFSLGALGQDNYKRIYARGNFDNLVGNLRALNERRITSGTCSDLNCLTMLSSQNLSGLHDLMRFLSDQGVMHHKIFPMYLKKGDPRYLGQHMTAWEETVEEAFGLADQLGMELRVVDWPVPVEHSEKVLRNFPCHRPWSHIHINVDGVVGLCDYNEHVDDMANLLIGKMDFEDIWNSKEYQLIRKNFLAGTPSQVNTFCGDVCRHTKYIDFDDSILPGLAGRVLSNKSREL